MSVTKSNVNKRSLQYECPYCYADSGMRQHSCEKCGTSFQRARRINVIKYRANK